MNSPLVGIVLPVRRWTQGARWLLAVTSFAAGICSSHAQKAVSTLAGTGATSGFVDATGADARFRFDSPSSAAVDTAGNVYVADTSNHAIRRITPAGVVTTFAGSAGVAGFGESGAVDGTGTAARFSSPTGLAIDGAGNLYVADSGNHAIRMITPAGVVSTLAGLPGPGNSGYVNATGTAARFRFPRGVATDRAAGGVATNVFVADTQNNAIRQIVVATGVVTTLAGSDPSTGGIGGHVNGAAADARFLLPQGIAAFGPFIYVADTGNNVVRRITIGTVVDVITVAGSGAAGFADSAGTSAVFNAPFGVAVDVGGGVYVSDTMNHVVRTIGASALTATLAGSPTVAGTSDGLATSGALFNRPTGIAIDAFNNVYVVDSLNGTVRKIANASFPIITTQPVSVTVGLGQPATFTVASTANPPPQFQWQRLRAGESAFVNLTDGNGYAGTATATLTISETNVLMSGDLYQAVVTNGLGSSTSFAAQLTLTAGTVYSTWVGLAGAPGAIDGTGTVARLRQPTSIAIDASGNVYIADSANHVIRKVSSGGAVTTFAGLAGLSGTADGFQTVARFNTPSGVTLDTSGNVYVADTGNHTIRRISPEGQVTTLAGSGGLIGNADGTGAAARFSFPFDLTVDSAGNLYVADTLNHAIRKIVISTGVVTTFVPASAGLQFPSGVALDAALNLYVSDSRNHVIRKVTPAAVVSVLAGTPILSGTANGTGADARFNNPQGLFVDGTGNVYVADAGNHAVRLITPAGVVTTLAGLPGTSGAIDGPGTQARFNAPSDIAIDAQTNIYVADTQNHVIRRTGTGSAPLITTQPTSQMVAVGGSATFTAAATGSPTPNFQWQRQAAGTTGFVTLANDATFSGTNTATLTISGVTIAMSGDQFQVVATNLVGTPVTSAPAVLTVVAPPVITSPATASFRAGEAGTFTITATGTPVVTFSATGLPSWATLNPTSGVITGTPPNTTGSPFVVVVTANNTTLSGTATTQNLVLTVLPANIPASITSQPVSVAVNRGQTATLTVAAAGTGALSYQWFKDGVAISGATSSTLTITNAQPSTVGIYSVRVSNSFGSATSQSVTISVNTAPELVTPPRAQTVLAGSSVTFSVNATGGGLSYQWRKNGVSISGATGLSLTLNNVSAADAANYDVVVTNALGSITTSVAQLIVATAPTTPVFTAQPASRTAVAGSSVVLSAAAMGVPAPNYQWRRNGIPISGATSSTLTFANVQPGDAANYDVVVTNSSGSVTSQAGTLRVIARSYAGVYFGSLAGGLGNFALYVREDNSAVFLAYLPSAVASVVNLSLTVADNGQFSFTQITSPGLAGVGVSGSIADGGAVSGSMSGSVNASFTGSRSADQGETQNFAGFHVAGATNNASVAYLIAGATGQAFAVVQAGLATDGGSGTVNSVGSISISTGRSTISAISQTNGVLSLASSGALTVTLSGGSETAVQTQRLANISSRARVTGTTSLAIAGFVVSGTESKPVLIRAVGPSLANFGITDRLATPALQLFRGQTVIASNTGVGTSADSAAIAAAATRAGAFALTSTADSALLVTLPPGNYTAQVSGANNTAGVVLVEVYDLSAPAVAQKLLNISTRAFAGTGADVLTAGIVVTGSVPKRVLIRGVGPGLAQFGLTGVLATPTLSLIRGSTTVASNTGWNTSTDAAAITTSSAQVGAFPLTTGDSAMIVTLTPGDYSAQVSGTAGATGTAIVEVYELP